MVRSALIRNAIKISVGRPFGERTSACDRVANSAR